MSRSQRTPGHVIGRDGESAAAPLGSPTDAVLIVGNFLHAETGTFSVCEELAAQLKAAGWSVITTSAYRPRFKKMVDMLQTTWSRRQAYAVAQVDVYSGASFSWAEAVCWLLRRCGRPYVLTLHGGALPEFAATRQRRVSALLRSAAAVTTPSDYLRLALAAHRSDILVQPNPIDASNYSFQLRRTAQPRLVWVRGFHEMYNPVMALRVVASLRSEIPRVRLLMVGPDRGDGSAARTRAAARDLGVADCVEFRGAVPKWDLPRVFTEGDIFLNTTNVDNTPVTVVEALASGLCVVSTSVGGIPHLVTHEHDALLVPPDDVAAMVHAVRRILETPALAERLSLNGRANALGRDWAVMRPMWERLLRTVVVGLPAARGN